MGKESHAIIILGIQYNNCIVDRKISGKKNKGKEVPRKGKGDTIKGRKTK